MVVLRSCILWRPLGWSSACCSGLVSPRCLRGLAWSARPWLLPLQETLGSQLWRVDERDHVVGCLRRPSDTSPICCPRFRRSRVIRADVCSSTGGVRRSSPCTGWARAGNGWQQAHTSNCNQRRVTTPTFLDAALAGEISSTNPGYSIPLNVVHRSFRPDRSRRTDRPRTATEWWAPGPALPGASPVPRSHRLHERCLQQAPRPSDRS